MPTPSRERRPIPYQTRVSPCVQQHPDGTPSPYPSRHGPSVAADERPGAQRRGAAGPRACSPTTCASSPPKPTALVDAPPVTSCSWTPAATWPVARSLCRVLRATGMSVPLIAMLTEGVWPASPAEWGVDDVMLESRRTRRGRGAAAPGRGTRCTTTPSPRTCQITAGELDDRRGDLLRPGPRAALLDLTYKEFELLKYLAQHPGRVFSRAQLLQEVWGYDYFGGTRTVDVHVRRLRAKLGPEHEVADRHGPQRRLPLRARRGPAAPRTPSPPTPEAPCTHALTRRRPSRCREGRLRPCGMPRGRLRGRRCLVMRVGAPGA